jgi:hypothetical protein
VDVAGLTAHPSHRCCCLVNAVVYIDVVYQCCCLGCCCLVNAVVQAVVDLLIIPLAQVDVAGLAPHSSHRCCCLINAVVYIDVVYQCCCLGCC